MAGDGQDSAHTLGWGEVVHPIRPKTFARTPTIPQKVTNVSICDKGPGHPEGYPGPMPQARRRAYSAAGGGVVCSDDEKEERWIESRYTRPSINLWKPTTTSARYKPACAILRIPAPLL